MYRLFLDADQFSAQDGLAHITGQDYTHLIRVLRARLGQRVVLLDGRGGAFLSEITRIEAHLAVAAIIESIEAPPEPIIAISVAQALGKLDKFEQVVQHGTEAGATEFVPLLAEHSVVSIPKSRFEDRVMRWRAIAKHASEQSFRIRIPDICAPVPLKSIIQSSCSRGEFVLLMHTTQRCVPLFEVLAHMDAPPTRITVCIGPEGGWSENELADAEAAGCHFVSLGAHTLRTETAALIAISQLLYHFSRPGEMSRCVS